MFEFLAQIIARVITLLSALTVPNEQVSELPIGVIWFEDYKPVPVVVEERVTATAVQQPYIEHQIGAGVEQWRELVASIFPSENVEAVLRVMQCESGGNPNATGKAGEMGLMQVHPYYHADATYDPEGNLRAAYRISGGGYSWEAWTCKP